MVILRSPAGEVGKAIPGEFHLVRANAASARSERRQIEKAMYAANEPDGLVESRFIHGDQLFGWSDDGRIVSFCWVTLRDRTVGPVALKESPGRVFLYNVYTLPNYRDRGLMTSLLRSVTNAITRENATEFIAEVNVTNQSSLRAFEKAGFVVVANVEYLTVCRRWDYPLRRLVIDRSITPVFAAS
jgi:ribosomal protein S18 acetylase RimI-like enzyme